MTWIMGLHGLVQAQFEAGGETTSNYTKVSVTFLHDKGKGFNLKQPRGLPISGDLGAFLPKDENS